MKTIIEMAREAGLHRTQHNLMSNPVKHRFSYDGYEENLEAFAELVCAEAQKKWEEQTDIDIQEAVSDERNAIYDQWHSCVMADLENGVKWLNEKAAAEWHKNYPAQSNLFPAWIEARGQA